MTTVAKDLPFALVASVGGLDLDLTVELASRMGVPIQFQWWSDRVGATGLALYGRRLCETIDSATGYAERHGALALIDEHVSNSRGATLGADAGYDTADFVAAAYHLMRAPT